MNRWLSTRRLQRRRRPRISLRLEDLEARNLLDSQALFHPEAVLRPLYGVRGTPLPPDSAGHHQPPPPGGFPNVPVNDPAEDGRSSQDTQSETSLVLAGGTVIAAFNDSTLYDPAHTSYHFTGYSVSGDGGQSFQDAGALPNTPGGDCGDPVLARDDVTGRVYFATLSCQNPSIPLFRTDDNFATIMPAVNAIPGHSGLMDKEWITVDNTAGDGQGNVYVLVRDFGSGNGIFFSRSTDHGATFGPSGGVPIVSGANGNVQGAWVTVGPDHAVYAFWFDNTTSTEKIMMRKSTDGGLTFGTPVTVTTLRTTGINGDLNLGGGFRSNAFAQALANPVTGQLYVVYDDKAAGNDKSDVYFRYSNDGGTTWSAAADIIDDTTGHDQWQPALAVTPNGNTVGVFWYDRRVDPADNLIDRFGALGVVAGGKVVFGPNFRITDTSFPVEHGHDSVVNSVYMGDYDQAVADNTGFYLTWGDNRLPSLGHMGNTNDVRFTHITVSVAGPAVIAVTPRGATFPPIGGVRVTFDEPIDPKTFTPDQFQLFDPSGNPIKITSITPVDDSDVRFDVTFDALTTTGIYGYQVGPYITDQSGNYMDQNGDGIPGEDPDDAFFGTVNVAGPKITASTPTPTSTNLPGAVDHIRVTFSEPIDPASFTFDEVYLAGPDGSQIPVNDIEPVGTSNTVFDVSFDALYVAGTYQVVIGPYITDPFGNYMDQNGNYIVGEFPDDQYATTFTVTGPVVTQFARNGQQNQPVSSVRVTFNEPIDPTTFTPDQVAALLDPQGNPIKVTDVQPVAGSNNTRFDISFDTQTLYGTYRVQIASGVIADFYGNALAVDFTATFIVTPMYTASAYDFEPLDIHGLPGTFRVIQSGDDVSNPVNLGAHTFNFYGVVYTGNNRLYASSNGLITFGASNTDFTNSNLTTTPPQPAIAVLWSDWIKTSGTDLLEGYFDDANGRLILQWNGIMHLGGSNVGVTFQLILYLDTGGVPGDIVFNYVFLNTGDQYRDGLASTVGIKNAGNQGTDRVLVTYRQDHMWVHGGQAILVTLADQGGAPARQRGRPAVKGLAPADPADITPAMISPDALTPARSAFTAAPALPGRASAEIPPALRGGVAAGSVDQVFTRFGAGGPLAGTRHHHAAGDGIDPLILDLLEQGAPV